MRVRAPVAAVSRTRVASPVAVTTVVRRAARDVAVIARAEPASVPESEHSRDEKPDDVDNGQCPRSLEHDARLRRRPVDSRSRDGHFADTGCPAITEGDIHTVRIGDSTQVVDTSDERTDEAQVDECDKPGVCG